MRWELALAYALAPIYLFVVLTVIGVPIQYAIKRWGSDRVKRIFLWRIPYDWKEAGMRYRAWKLLRIQRRAARR